VEVQLEDVKPGILWNIGKVREDSDLVLLRRFSGLLDILLVV
jgi:hypothetical protein